AEGLGISRAASDRGTQSSKFSASQNGVLVYGGGTTGVTRLNWFDRAGHNMGVFGSPGLDIDFRISPDGDRVAAQREDGSGRADIWLFDVMRGSTARLRSPYAYNFGPVWSPNGRRITFASIRERWELYEQDSTGEGEATLVVKADGNLVTHDWSPDGEHLLYGAIATNTRTADLNVLSGGRDGPPRLIPITRTRFDENDGRFSPD